MGREEAEGPGFDCEGEGCASFEKRAEWLEDLEDESVPPAPISSRHSAILVGFATVGGVIAIASAGRPWVPNEVTILLSVAVIVTLAVTYVWLKRPRRATAVPALKARLQSVVRYDYRLKWRWELGRSAPVLVVEFVEEEIQPQRIHTLWKGREVGGVLVTHEEAESPPARLPELPDDLDLAGHRVAGASGRAERVRRVSAEGLVVDLSRDRVGVRVLELRDRSTGDRVDVTVPAGHGLAAADGPVVERVGYVLNDFEAFLSGLAAAHHAVELRVCDEVAAYLERS